MSWDRESSSYFITLLMFLTFVLLVLNKKKLGDNIIYFILAIGLGIFIECLNAVNIYLDRGFSSITNYVIGVNFFVFFLFFLYFHNLLSSERFKRISLLLILLFLLNYVLFAIFDKCFFVDFPFLSYFIEVVLLMSSMYLVMSQTFNSDRILALGSYYPVWICIGLMVIYLGMLPLLIVSKTAGKMMNVNFFFMVMFIVNVIGYVILITGICFAENRKMVPEDEAY